jgi:polyisoprenoid-binding protein YceI
MNAIELNELLRSGNACLLINVLPEEVHSARRIPGSVNACVYETAFLDKVAMLVSSNDQPIIVHGAGGSSLDSKVAAETLRAAGYRNVTVFTDGIAGWEAAGFPFEGDGLLPQAPVLDGRFVIDTTGSLIRWTGRNPLNHHHGTVRLASGEIVLRHGELISARFEIDMDTIACDDLADATWNAMLISHLKAADFFLTEKFPMAGFEATGAEPIPGCSEGTTNHLLRGNLTLRGVTNPLEFPILVASADGARLTGQAQFEVDRTAYGSIYGSGKFFSFLGKHVVNDLIHLHVMVHADRA